MLNGSLDQKSLQASPTIPMRRLSVYIHSAQTIHKSIKNLLAIMIASQKKHHNYSQTVEQVPVNFTLQKISGGR
jgi:hypothetical protein